MTHGIHITDLVIVLMNDGLMLPIMVGSLSGLQMSADTETHLNETSCSSASSFMIEDASQSPINLLAESSTFAQVELSLCL